jgi:hypothetical protein
MLYLLLGCEELAFHVRKSCALTGRKPGGPVVCVKSVSVRFGGESYREGATLRGCFRPIAIRWI